MIPLTGQILIVTHQIQRVPIDERMSIDVVTHDNLVEIVKHRVKTSIVKGFDGIFNEIITNVPRRSHVTPGDWPLFSSVGKHILQMALHRYIGELFVLPGINEE